MDHSINQSGVNYEHDGDEQIAGEKNKTRLSQCKKHTDKIGTTTLTSATLAKKIVDSSKTSYTECSNRRHPSDKDEIGAATSKCHFQQSVACKGLQQRQQPPSGNIGNILSILNDMTASEIRDVTGSSLVIDELMIQAR